MSLADLVAVVFLLAVTAYAIFGGADFGAGLWDLVAGGSIESAAPRALINRAVSQCGKSTPSMWSRCRHEAACVRVG
jgi:cytochrome bd-type quinol oxidase subunit 2